MKNKNCGAALVIVIFIAAILASMTILLIIKTKQHIERVSIAKQYMQAEREMISDLNYLIFLTQTHPFSIMGDSNLSSANRNILPNDINLQGKKFSFRKSIFSIQDMGGLISLIPLDRDIVIRYLTKKGWPTEQIVILLDVIEDWQDKDSFKRLNGAESFDYDVFGYPLNQPLQSTKDLGLFVNIDNVLLNQLINDSNVLLYAASRSATDYAPDYLLSIFNSEYDAEIIQEMRNSHRAQNKVTPTSHYSSGNWIIQVNTSVGQGKSSKIVHLLRRLGDHRPFVISNQ